ncbi:PSD1 and planctomycete cytochrome C domain-containing protein [Stieleria sp. TO1_6]|uniref:PSD1 and planctomycete cytochrome C domain-containing protein n=1 Tax=Stieleria tagensis TaxID=2956795 RepID=UPI00209A8356|nr:PSD1 and planctomycete cytochrome C domain-containing protein [Stieleria tagensis]MCO8125229.1 PSD1 and planctomycete cytochrome C domain-containing protein [Stieleria tagensis]
MTKICFFLFFALLYTGLCVTSAVIQAGEQTPSADQLDFFEREVRPLLAKQCYQCHSAQAKRVEGNLLLDSREAHLRGGDSGTAVVPGDVDGSLLIEAVRYESYEMPPKGKLGDHEIAVLERWIAMGAPWPEEAPPTADNDQHQFDLETRKSEFWAWQPIADTETPVVKDRTWPHNELDHYTLARLEAAGLKPSRDADRTAILRRLSFDLIGLPPTPDEVEAFVSDPDSLAVEHVVDRLLDSPHFGEHWGRHWLDLTRYAESRGHEFDNDTPNAFQYRDYVIRALNADVPYDQFVREHIAGDLLPQPRLHPTNKFNESILGTGFWYLGEWVHSPVDIRKDEADRFDNMLDVMSKTFLGVTVACARCHDHKFDAISTADYYSLSGFLQSSDYRQVRFESMEQNRRVARRLARVDEKYQRRIQDLLNSHGVRLPSQTSSLNDKAIVVNYANLAQRQFLQDGYLFGQSPRRQGLAYLSPESGSVKIATFGAAVSDPIWSGLESITEGAIQNRSTIAKLPKSGRTLRSPTFELTDGRVQCLVSGVGTIVACVDSHRLVAGPLHKETIVPVKAGQRWVKLDLHRYVGHRLHLEFIPAVNEQLSVRLVTQGLDPEGLADLDRRLAVSDKQYEDYANAAEAVLKGGEGVQANEPVSADSKLQRHPSWTLTGNASKIRPSPGKGVPFQIVDNQTADRSVGPSLTPRVANSAAQHIIRAWQQERKQLASQIVRRSRVAPAMMDGTGEDDHILIRGNSSKPGETEPRHFLTAISGDSPMSIGKGSGRLELAAHINDPANPLTSRVIVNRIWHHLMGRGIVPTVDDLGFLGQRPTHPELLDHLATRFLAEGRSIKQMIRHIVLSRTYQLSSHPDPDAIQADPKNLLWHHQPPRRLQGEAIRDSLLALSGRLDRTAFGPPVPIHLTSFMDGRGRPSNSGPLDGNGRRSIYIAVRRNFLSPFMLTFDTPVPFSSMGRRNVSNVPAQALTLLNDPLVVELSRQWGERALQSVADSDDKAMTTRIEWMYRCGFGRSPTKQESETAAAYLRTQASKRKITANAPELWASFAHALVNTKEFIFLR